MSDIQVTRDGHVVEIVIARPARKNALTLAMYETMTRALDEAREDDGVRAVIFRGEGGSFTAGNDLGDFMAAPPTSEDAPVFRFLLALSSFPKPILAAPEGPAIGIGTTMLLHCDLVYAAETTRFQLPFVNLGLVPEAASSLLLPRMLGHVKAAELLLLGEPFDAKTALRLGLINDVLPAGEHLTRTRERAHTLAEKAPEAVRSSKRLMKEAFSEETLSRMRAEAKVFGERLTSPELAEAIAAFFEKRKPVFG
jgi:enoyl-CoA hydratase/carnithine racemase